MFVMQSSPVQASCVLNQFYSLLCCENFLLCFVRILDSQPNFSVKERSAWQLLYVNSTQIF